MSEFRAIEIGDYAAIETPRSLGQPPRLEWLSISALVIDPEYQREITSQGRTNVRRIASAFDWAMFAPVVVAPAGGDRFAIVDGQHRTTAAKLCGLDRVPCIVVNADRALQAKAFGAINGNLTRVHSLHLFHAAVAAGVKEALHVADICRQAGVMIMRNPTAHDALKPNQTAVASIIGKTAIRFGDAITVQALKIIVATEAGALSRTIIWGVVEVLHDHPEWSADDVALRKTFENLNLDEMLLQARSKAAHMRGSSPTDQFEALLVDAFDARAFAEEACMTLHSPTLPCCQTRVPPSRRNSDSACVYPRCPSYPQAGSMKNLVQSDSEQAAAAGDHPCGNDAAASCPETVIAPGAGEHAARLKQPSLPRHRWPAEGVATSPNKTERECQNGCGIVKVTRHETEGGRDLHWTEFWRGLDRIEGSGTPPCIGPATAVTYGARNYPL